MVQLVERLRYTEPSLAPQPLAAYSAWAQCGQMNMGRHFISAAQQETGSATFIRAKKLFMKPCVCLSARANIIVH